MVKKLSSEAVTTLIHINLIAGEKYNAPEGEGYDASTHINMS